MTSIATFVVAWNCLFGEYQDLKSITHEGIFHGVLPLMQLPLVAFTLSSPSLGLLLVFRTNSAYKRWDEARKNWGMNINHTRDLVRMGNAYYDRQAVSPEQAKADLETLALNTWCFVRCMKRHLSPEWEDEGDFRNSKLRLSSMQHIGPTVPSKIYRLALRTYQCISCDEMRSMQQLLSLRITLGRLSVY